MLIDKETHILVQGITGKEGQKAAREMLDYHTKVTCGVTPGKGGQVVEGLPVFNSVNEAKGYDPNLSASVIYVPPLRVYAAVKEAMESGMRLIVIITENVPILDAAKMVEEAEQKGVRIIGPSSIGLIEMGKAKIGSIAKNSEIHRFKQGNVAIVSKSGGMCAETAFLLTQAGIGQSLIVGIGGDVVMGTSFTDMLEILEEDSETDAVVLFGEIGGTYEQQVAEMVKHGKFTKPIVAFISGRFAESLERSMALGHAGAIVQGGNDTAQEKKRILRQNGIHVADYHHEIPDLVKKALK